MPKKTPEARKDTLIKEVPEVKKEDSMIETRSAQKETVPEGWKV